MIRSLQSVEVRSSSTLVAARNFGRYKSEVPQAVRKPELKENETLAQLKQAWAKFELTSRGTDDDVHESVCDVIRNLKYSAKDVEKFSLALANFEQEPDFETKAGYFLSALINNGLDSDYVVHTDHLSLKINYLGFKNQKNIIVKGNVRDNLGRQMTKGSIIINGDAENDVGHRMTGGVIIIKGNTGNWTGIYMVGGEITLNGNASAFVGDSMRNGVIYVLGNVGCAVGNKMMGGEIHLDGTYDSIYRNPYEGKIFHKGKLIRPISF